MALKPDSISESKFAKRWYSKGSLRRHRRDAKRAATRLRRKAKEQYRRVTKGWL